MCTALYIVTLFMLPDVHINFYRMFDKDNLILVKHHVGPNTTTQCNSRVCYDRLKQQKCFKKHI